MPECCSQVVICDLPVHMDTYRGCTHNCAYCFVRRKNLGARVAPAESVATVRRFVVGRRTAKTAWCDWPIPLHWGGLSDPFQPAEKKAGRSRDMLEMFADTQYPVVVSTKGILVAEEPYLSLVHRANLVVQMSLVAPEYDQVEPGAPSYADRQGVLAALAEAAKRVIVRVQPYVPTVLHSVLSAFPRWADMGVYGVVVEGIKHQKKRPGLVRVTNDWCYPVQLLRRHFHRIRQAAHDNGLRFYAGENRLRRMGDDPCCCGIDGLGWRPNNANLNHIGPDGRIDYTPKMLAMGTAKCFGGISQSPVSTRWVAGTSYAHAMDAAARSRTFRQAMGMHLTPKLAEG